MRAGPGADFAIVATLKREDIVTVVTAPEPGSNWVEVRATDVQGWVNGRYLAPGSAASSVRATATAPIAASSDPRSLGVSVLTFWPEFPRWLGTLIGPTSALTILGVTAVVTAAFGWFVGKLFARPLPKLGCVWFLLGPGFFLALWSFVGTWLAPAFSRSGSITSSHAFWWLTAIVSSSLGAWLAILTEMPSPPPKRPLTEVEEREWDREWKRDREREEKEKREREEESDREREREADLAWERQVKRDEERWRKAHEDDDD